MDSTIKRLKFWCQPVLPLTYDDSLSYIETLSKVVAKVNEVIEYAEHILETAEAYTDAEVAALKTVLEGEIAELRADMEQFKVDVYKYIDDEQGEFEDEVRALFQAQKDAIDAEFATLTAQVNALVSAISDSVDTLRTYVNSQDDVIKQSIRDYHRIAIEYVDSQVEMLEQEIAAIVLESVTKVIDPCDTKQKSLQECIDNMYYNLRSWAFQARRYDMLGLTAGEYDAVNGSAWNYDYLGKWYWYQKPEIMKYVDALWERVEKALRHVYWLINKRTITHSAWTGNKDKIRHVMDSCIQEVRTDGITAEMYDSLYLTCPEYAEYQLTSYEYDWHGLSKLVHPDETEFAEFALLEYRAAYATNNLLDMIVAGVSGVDVTDGVLSVSTEPFDGEPYDVQGIMSDTVARLGYQVYENIVAINKIIEQTKWQFKLDENTGVMDIFEYDISPIEESVSVNFAVICGQIMAVRNALGRLNDYYTYVMSISDEIYSITGTQLVSSI